MILCFFFSTLKCTDLCLDFHSFICNNEMYGTDWNYFTVLLWRFLVRINKNICLSENNVHIFWTTIRLFCKNRIYMNIYHTFD